MQIHCQWTADIISPLTYFLPQKLKRLWGIAMETPGVYLILLSHTPQIGPAITFLDRVEFLINMSINVSEGKLKTLQSDFRSPLPSRTRKLLRGAQDASQRCQRLGTKARFRCANKETEI